MSPGITHPAAPPATADALKSWVMVVLTLIFVALYGAALFGWLRPLTDDKMVMRLEPIIFAIIGYYFGRLPGQHNERTLKQEINRQTQRADASQSAKEQALQSSEALEEKVKNVRSALAESPVGTSSGAGLAMATGIISDEGLPHVVKAAVRILES
jgi:hypothetical protein